jgi:hypothetical protein
MTERSPERPHAAPRADPTRDIRLPPMPDRPAPAVPPEWSSYVPAVPAPSEPPAGATAIKPPATPEPAAGVPVAGPRQRVDEPTDRLASPDHPLRQGTRAFAPAPSVQLLKVSVTPTRRRTSKVLWTLIILTLAVIIACGVYLVVLVNQR